MVKITERKFNHVAGLHDFELENGDKLVMTKKEFDEVIYENEFYEFESVEEKKYTVEFEEHESLEHKPDLIGFNLIN